MQWTPVMPLAGKSLKVFGWLVIVFLAVQFAINHALRLSSPVPDGFDDAAGGFLLHTWVALPALLIGPFQFWGALRTRYLRVHRWCGRAYLLSVIGGSLSGLYLAVSDDGGLAARTGLGTMAVVWLLTADIAYLAIRRGRVLDHQAWMLRSYVVTFSFVTARLWLDWTAGLDVPLEERMTAMAWLCWVPSLFLVELGLSLRKINGFPTIPSDHAFKNVEP